MNTQQIQTAAIIQLKAAKTPAEMKVAIEYFCDAINEETRVMPDYTYLGHVVLGDYNLSDAHIKASLSPDHLSETIMRIWDNIRTEEDLYARTWAFASCFEAYAATIYFMRALLEVDEQMRESINDLDNE